MPAKRRLSAQSGGQEEEEDGGSSSTPASTPEPGRKRRRMDPAVQMQALFDFVRKYKKEEGGGGLVDSMTRLPNRRSDPGYYEAVDSPIDIMKIQQKLKTDEYSNMEELRADYELMIRNTKQYYKRGSPEHKDALELEELLPRAVQAVVNGDDPAAVIGSRSEEPEEPEHADLLEDLFGVVMTAVDPSEPTRVLNIVFQLLPSQKRYPEYYKHISDPIDLKTIAMRIQGSQYPGLQELEDDLQLLFKNATSFNEPGSQIYKDARTLSKLVKSKKLELEANKVARENRGAKSSRRQSKQNFSIQVANMAYEDSEEESSSSDEDLEDRQDDPLWQLYSAVRHYQTANGIPIAEAFLTLPSKRELPDYYRVIAEPISLSQIRKKLKSGDYSGLPGIADDLDKMFENCKTYNRPESKLYKDGVKLQKVMVSKLEELDSESELGINSPEPDGKRSPRDPRDQAKKRLKILYNCILHYANEDNIQPIGVFMEKPSRKDYPDYYEIITEPMDMNTINEKIRVGTYKSEEEMIADCKLMFSNCRLYNEEGSEIYEHANILERVLMNKARELGVLAERKKRKVVSLAQKIKSLYDTLKDYRDAKGRQLSLIFLKLPSKHEYPDYYEIIKRPIDLEKISSKIRSGSYDALEDALADFTLVFDNACKYNEPDSQIYKDAQTLQKLAHQTVRHLTEESESGLTDAKAGVQDILSGAFGEMYTLKDAEERCLVDSLMELAEHDEVNGKKVRALNLEIVKRRIDRGVYKRMDLLQRDVFFVLDRARKLSRTDSQAFEDSTELQKAFIAARNKACGNGTVLKTRALDYTLEQMTQEVEAFKAAKAAGEQPIEEESNDGYKMESGTSSWSGMHNQHHYHVGDFVYVEPREKGMETHIFMVERLFEKDGAKILWGNQYFRQRETFHVPTRTFYERELAKGDLHEAIPISKVLGKCYVMPVKDYIKYKPEGYDEKDIFVCEWKYTSKQRNWKKVKTFWDPPEHITIVPREKPLEPKRVASVFKDRIERHKEEIEELEVLEKKVDEEIPANVRWAKEDDSDGLNYWEQYTIPGPITLRRGDHVYVRGENNKNMIAQIDTMWTGQDGMAYFNGPWFVTPPEIPPQLGRVFWKNEAFLSSISDSNPLLSVVNKCLVLEMREYCSQRPSQYTDNDVYLCESLFDEGKRQIRQLPNGLKRYAHSPNVYPDEVYFFRKQIVPEKETLVPPMPVAAAASPIMATPGGPNMRTNISSPMLMMDEDSLDGAPSTGSIESASPAPGKKKSERKKVVTPYILFSADVRKMIMDENPGVTFGQISRIVAERWRQMTEQEKNIYAEKAKKVNEEKEREEARQAEERRRQAEMAARNPPPLLPTAASSPGPAMNPGSPAQKVRQDSGGQIRGGMMGGPVGQPLNMEPLFHTVPPRPQRLLHSEAYIRYIEGLNKDSRAMSNWDRQLNATKELVKVPDEVKLPAAWLAGNFGEHATSHDALWALRDFMLQEALGVVRIM